LPAIDSAVAVFVSADAVEDAAFVILPVVDLAVVVGVALNSNQLAVLVVFEHVGGLIELGVELFSDQVALVKIVNGVDSPIEGVVELFCGEFLGVVVVPPDVEGSIEVDVDLLADQFLGGGLPFFAGYLFVDGVYVGDSVVVEVRVDNDRGRSGWRQHPHPRWTRWRPNSSTIRCLSQTH